MGIRGEGVTPGAGGCGSEPSKPGGCREPRRVRVPFCVFLHRAAQLGAVFYVHLVILADKIVHKQIQNSFMLKLFPNISTALQQIQVFKTSVNSRTMDFIHIRN